MKDKAILVIDMPECCSRCKLCFLEMYGAWCAARFDIPVAEFRNYYKSDTKPDWCPLQPMPEKRENHCDMSAYEFGEVDGWNACIDKILGDNQL